MLTPRPARRKNQIPVFPAVAEYIDWFNHRRLHGENELITQPSSRTTFTAQHRGDYRRRVSSEPPLNPARDTGLLLDHEHEPKADPDL